MEQHRVTAPGSINIMRLLATPAPQIHCLKQYLEKQKLLNQVLFTLAWKL
jgi:hypothetical protein